MYQREKRREERMMMMRERERKEGWEDIPTWQATATFMIVIYLFDLKGHCHHHHDEHVPNVGHIVCRNVCPLSGGHHQ